MIDAFALLLTILVLVTAGWIAVARDTRAVVFGFIGYGLLLSLVWVLLSSVDVALTEAAIGGGATGILLLRVAARLKVEPHPAPGRAMRISVGVLCAIVTAALAAIVLTLPDPAPSLAPLTAEHLASTELGNPVTAVLLAYRALDTLLEIFVLLLALIGVWSLGADRYWGGAPAEWNTGMPAPALAFLARILPPFGIVFAAYLFWVGADEPGGKFQTSTILAAMWLLVVMAGILPMPQTGGRRIRAALAIGPVVFIAIGFAGIPMAGGFLAYPEGFAKPLIILIEAALAFSIVAALTLLVAGPAEQAPRS